MRSSNPSLASRAAPPSTSPGSTANSHIDLGNEKPSEGSTSSHSQSADSTVDPYFYRSAAPSPSSPPSDTQSRLPPLDHPRKRPADFGTPPTSVDSLTASDTESTESQLNPENTTATATGADTGNRGGKPSESRYFQWAKTHRPKASKPLARTTAVSTRRSASSRTQQFDANSEQWRRNEEDRRVF